MECTCYKDKKCDVCIEWKYGKMFREVRELIQKYPNAVKELIEHKNG